MSSDLAVVDGQSVVSGRAILPDWTPEQVQLITDVVARGATPDELKLFLYRCKNMGLDPLKPGMVHFIKYGNNPGTIVVGIDGFRSISERTGKKAGVKRGVVKENNKLIAAWCEVYRSDWKEPAREEVPFSEYNTGKGPWAKMPETMLKKVAEAAALRMAFPDALGGVYIHEEMDQAKSSVTGGERVAPDQPAPGDGIQETNGYRIPFGQYTHRSLEEVGPQALRAYIISIEKKAAKDNKEITGIVKDFIERATNYIVAIETGMPVESTQSLLLGVV